MPKLRRPSPVTTVACNARKAPRGRIGFLTAGYDSATIRPPTGPVGFISSQGSS
ncbi:hypothetical protein PanWU01x14_352900, partial [Parasponia andersonii]